MSENVSVAVTYDRGADVLYVSMANEPAAKGVEDARGIVWRYGADGRLVGATVVGFLEVWSQDGAALATVLAQHFQIPRSEAMEIVVKALRER